MSIFIFMKRMVLCCCLLTFLMACIVMSPAPKRYFYATNNQKSRLILSQYPRQVLYTFHDIDPGDDSVQVFQPLIAKWFTLKRSDQYNFYRYADEAKKDIRQIMNSQSVVIRKYRNTSVYLDTLRVGREVPVYN